jgi:hypothetical protein
MPLGKIRDVLALSRTQILPVDGWPTSADSLSPTLGRTTTRRLRYLQGEDDATIGFSMSEERDRVVTVSILETALNDLEKRLEKRIGDEGAATRTHFDVMVERVESAVKLVAEVNAHHATVLDNHESRLQKIEKRA